MHILLTDVLTCPRCGPEMGLIVLADRMHERRVVEGRLGCANCREEYPVHEGVADLRAGPITGTREDVASDDGEPEDRAFRIAALLGIGRGTGVALIVGASPRLLDRVAALLPNAQVVGASAQEPSSTAGAGWILHGPGLPFRDRSLRGVAVVDGTAASIGDAARILAPGAHLVLDPAPEDGTHLVAAAGLTLILDQDEVTVASAPGAR